MMTALRSSLLAVSLTLLCAVGQSQFVGQPSIVANAVATPALFTLVSVLTMPEYEPILAALSSSGPFTVFAPTNAAFEKAGVDVTNVAAVTNVLQYHVLAGQVMSSSLRNGQTATTLNGQDVRVSVVRRGRKNRRSRVVKINDATVVIADVRSSNGVVHVIDQVLLPPASAPYSSSQPSIVDLAVATPALSTLVSVLTQPAFAGILQALQGDGPFTVFAPTNDAFAAAAAAGVDLTDVAAVTSVLQYHVIAGAGVKSTDLAARQSVPSLNGASLDIRSSSFGVSVDGANVVLADVIASNGVVHVIDQVLLPPTAAIDSPFLARVFAAKQPLTIAQAREVINTAIDIGAPLHNAGDYAGCYRAYARAAFEVIMSDNVAAADMAAAMVDALAAGNSPSDSAWDIRRGFDSVLANYV